MSIKILDANDNAPEFTQARYSASIPWNVTKNELVTTVHAVDNDAGDNAKITYSIVRVIFCKLSLKSYILHQLNYFLIFSL